MPFGSNVHFAGRNEYFLLGDQYFFDEGEFVGEIVAGRRRTDGVVYEWEEVTAERAGRSLPHQGSWAAITMGSEMKKVEDECFSFLFGNRCRAREDGRVKEGIFHNRICFGGSFDHFSEANGGVLKDGRNVIGGRND